MANIESGAQPEIGRDYTRIATAIRYLDQNRQERPDLKQLADHVGLSPHHFQRLFRRWCGLTPKQFLAYLTVEDAKPLLDANWPVMEVSDALGLSGASRLHDTFISIDAMTPGEYKRRGSGMQLRYGTYSSPFGDVLMAHGERGICLMEFVDGDEGAVLERAKRRWPMAELSQDNSEAQNLVDQAFDVGETGNVPVHLNGTNFQVRTWAALLATGRGATVTYGQLARSMGAPKAARAVGTALGSNPVAWLIPCHRVIRSVGGVGGYRWGEERKRIMLAWERSRDMGFAA
jgi:AraC family transcriptional regulator of adaptative response/methylated-DNA-[protein]-cysteine methyltransferase